MSSTNRGAPRQPNDFYPTPDWLTRPMCAEIIKLRSHPVYGGSEVRILEPAAGEGAMMKVLRDMFPVAYLEGFDIRRGDVLVEGRREGSWMIKGGVDFLTIPPRPEFDVIATNPPFSLAQEFIERAKLWRRNQYSLIVMLLRLNFLGSQKRAKWWRANPATILVTPRRPPFAKNQDGKMGTDSTEYGWFVWGLPGAPTYFHLPTEGNY